MKRLKAPKKYIKVIDFISELEHAGIKNLNVIEIPGLKSAACLESDMRSSEYDEKYPAGSKKKIIDVDDVLFISINSDGIKIA